MESRSTLPDPLPDQITLGVWDDPVVATFPGSTRTFSPHTLTYWLPILGPATTLMAHHVAGWLERRDGEPLVMQRTTFGYHFGLAGRALASTLVRMESRYIGQLVAEPDALRLDVRLVLPPLSIAQRQRLPHALLTSLQRSEAAARTIFEAGQEKAS